MFEWKTSYVLSWHHFTKTRLNSANWRSFPRKTNVSLNTYAASASEQSPFSLMHKFFLNLWSFDPFWGDDLPVSRVLRRLIIYEVRMWASRPTPNLRAMVSLFVRYLARHGRPYQQPGSRWQFHRVAPNICRSQCGTSCMSPSWHLEYRGRSSILWEIRAPLL
jgi:hypothetical protein